MIDHARWARDRMTLRPVVQSIVRRAARRGLVPPAALRRVPVSGIHPVTTPGGNALRYQGTGDDVTARQVVWENLKTWEASSFRVWSRLAAQTSVVLDVGAYAGIYALVACADGALTAFAFEPNPASRVLLERNIALNDFGSRITVVPKGASDKSGPAGMVVPEDPTAAYVAEAGDGVRIELTTVDEVAGDLAVGLMKIDVEGLEPDVIRGAVRTIERNRPAILSEALSEEGFDATRAVLEDLGYRRCHHLAATGPMTTDRWVPSPFANYLWRAGEGPHPGSSRAQSGPV